MITQRKIMEYLKAIDPNYKNNPTFDLAKLVVSLIKDKVSFDAVVAATITRNFKAGEVIKDYSEREYYANILIKGCVVAYVAGKDRDICISILFEDEMFSDYVSLWTQRDASIRHVALEDTEIISIPYTALQETYANNPHSLQLPKVTAEILYIKEFTEHIDHLTLSVGERYQKLLEHRPDILMRVPLKIIASYLGLTPESFSRLRKRYQNSIAAEE